MRKIFIGDVHGCLEELQGLVEKLAITTQDKIVFVGYLLDKGPVCSRARQELPGCPR